MGTGLGQHFRGHLNSDHVPLGCPASWLWNTSMCPAPLTNQSAPVQRVLVLKVVEEGSLGHRGLGADGLDSGGVVILIEDQIHCDSCQLPGGGGGLSLAY